jgi:pyruvate kinase
MLAKLEQLLKDAEKLPVEAIAALKDVLEEAENKVKGIVGDLEHDATRDVTTDTNALAHNVADVANKEAAAVDAAAAQVSGAAPTLAAPTPQSAPENNV